MSKLTKDEVISALEAALLQQEKRTVNIEQNGSWFKIDGGKSLRFSELETMLADLQSTAPQAKAPKAKAPTATDVKPVTAAKKQTPSAPAAKTAAKKATTTASKNTSGKTPKELWREKLANEKSQSTLPRGF